MFFWGGKRPRLFVSAALRYPLVDEFRRRSLDNVLGGYKIAPDFCAA